MKSPLHIFVIRLMTNELMFSVAGMYVYLRLPVAYPNLAFLWSFLALVVLALSCYVMYTGAWRFGERDRNLVKYNHLTYQPWRGFTAGGIAVAMPLILMVLLAVNDITLVKIIYCTVIFLSPLASGFGYLNGHKLKYDGISIVYRRRGR
ncbi:MAG: hypothetical protein FWH16_04180 [Oscillospiraceae bacterium]|nr:hypothetical protein [Oscillospiraceae bacterium]